MLPFGSSRTDLIDEAAMSIGYLLMKETLTITLQRHGAQGEHRHRRSRCQW